ncbi:MAG: DUF3308 domain-containing protein [Calditrichaeota bacterium]|nr:MAG: DUF3308 domain-containing protein [Calditrichota bacterium]
MKKTIFQIFTLILLGLMLAPTHVFSQDKVGQTGLKFLDVGVGARAAGMGEAFTLVGDDANALFYNPAGIALIEEKYSIMAHRTEWFADISYNAFAATVNLDVLGTFGASFVTADYPNSMGTIVADNEQGYIETGNFSGTAFSVGLAYARSFTDKFTFGGRVNFAHQNLGENMVPVIESAVITDTSNVKNDVGGLAYDIGTIFVPGFKSLKLGMSITNYSAQFEYEEDQFQLPLTFNMGASMDVLDLLDGDYSDMSFVVDIEALHPRDFGQRIHAGGEFWYKDTFALRSGYKFNYDEESFSAGFGVKLSGARIDYAYSRFGIFTSVQRFSVGYAF